MVDVAAPGSAPASARSAQGEEPLKLVCFRVRGQEYAARIADVKETLAVRPITRVFLTPGWLAGIINLRGDIVAVLDLARLLGLPPARLTDASRIVICQHEGRIAGVMVDELAELRTLPGHALAPPPPTLPGEGAALLAGVATVDGGAPLCVLRMDSLLDPGRLRLPRPDAI